MIILMIFSQNNDRMYVRKKTHRQEDRDRVLKRKIKTHRMEQDNAYKDIKKKKMSPLFFLIMPIIFILFLQFKSAGMFEKNINLLSKYE